MAPPPPPLGALTIWGEGNQFGGEDWGPTQTPSHEEYTKRYQELMVDLTEKNGLNFYFYLIKTCNKT